jgi:hypothetical protein
MKQNYMNNTKQYIASLLAAVTLAIPTFAAEFEGQPKSIASKNAPRDDYGVMSMVIDINGVNYLARAQVRTDNDLYADMKIVEIESLVKAEIAKGTNGLVKITGGFNQAQKVISFEKITAGGYQIDCRGFYKK